MKKSASHVPAALLAWTVLATSAAAYGEMPAPAGVWTQFRGPGGSGVSSETGLLRGWGEGGPAVVWRRELGGGFSGLAVAGELLYSSFADGDAEYLAAFRTTDGSEVWRLTIGEPFADEFGRGPRSTPTLAGGMVYVLGGKGRLVAARGGSGELVWEVDLFARYGSYDTAFNAAAIVGPRRQIPNFGFSSSPLVDSGVVVVDTGAGEGRSFVAFDPETGAERWTALDGLVGYSTPLAVTLGGERQFLVLEPEEIVSLSPAGDVLWRQSWAVTLAQPVVLPGERVFVSTAAGEEPGAMLFQVDPDGGEPSTEVLWKSAILRNFWNSSVHRAGHLYGFDNATLKCVSAATGELAWAKRGLGKGSLLVADGLLFILSDRGLLVLAEATPDRYREAGRVRLFDEARTWTPPALADGRLYLRSPSEIVSLDVRRAKR